MGLTTVLVGAMLGLIGGLLEVAILALRKFAFKEVVLISPEFVWTVPVMAMLYTAGASLLVMIAIKPLHAVFQSRVGVVAAAFVALLGPVLAVPRLHIAAVLLMAAGLAVQIARVLRLPERHFPVRVMRTTAWLAVLVVGLGLGQSAVRAMRFQQAVRALPRARAGAPNVLLIVLDTVRAQNLSAYGYSKPTAPTLERVSKTGVTFRSAWSTAPWTLPSHAGLFTGYSSEELSTDWRSALDRTYPTVSEVLRDHGYLTAGFVANLIYGSAEHGLDRGFIHYDDFPHSIGQAVLNSSLGTLVGTQRHLRRLFDYHRVLNRKTAAEVNDEFLAWVEGQEGRPFFAFLNYMDAHEPYLPPDEYRARFGPARTRTVLSYSAIDAFRPGRWAMTAAEAESERAAYDGAIAYMDDQIGRLIEEVSRRGLLDSTVLIITSDHGEQLGEHRLYGHGNSLYRQLLEVPLLLSFPGRIPVGRIVEQPVSLRDLPATILELTGVNGDLPFPGASLSRIWNAATAEGPSLDAPLVSGASQRTFGAQQPWYPLLQGNMQSLVGAGFHYIHNDAGAEELYDFARDPAELHDLAGLADSRQIIEQFRVVLGRLRSGASTSRQPR